MTKTEAVKKTSGETLLNAAGAFYETTRQGFLADMDDPEGELASVFTPWDELDLGKQAIVAISLGRGMAEGMDAIGLLMPSDA